MLGEYLSILPSFVCTVSLPVHGKVHIRRVSTKHMCMYIHWCIGVQKRGRTGAKYVIA